MKTPQPELSPHQKDVADYMKSNAGQLIPYEDLLSKFWPGITRADIENDRRMVHKTIAQIKHKLGHERIKTSIGKGYIWIEETVKEQMKQGFHEKIILADKSIGGTYTLARMFYAPGGDYLLEVTQVQGKNNSIQNYNRNEFEALKEFVDQFK